MTSTIMTFGDMDDASSPVAVTDNNHTIQYDSPTHMNVILTGLNSLRAKNLLVDVILNAGGQAFEAHRAVLASCSDYFRVMFTSEVRESREKEVTLEGISAKGMNLLLDYIYTSRLQLSLSNIQDVLSAASHLQVITVVEACSSYLESQLDLENCVDLVQLAETYSLHQLKNRVYRFMSFHLMEFSQTPDFQRLSMVQLDYLLNCDYPVDCPESDVLQIVLQWIAYSNDRIPLGPILLNRIHFNEIKPDILKLIFWEHSILPCICSHSRTLHKALVAHMYGSGGDMSSVVVATPELKKAISSSSLVNSRGMELAIIKVGGFGLAGVTNEITYFLPSIGRWKRLTAIPHVEQCNFGTTVLDNILYVVGGCFNQCLQENIHPFGFSFNPSIDKWHTIAPMLTERCRFTLNVVEDKIYAIGGISENVEEIPNPEDCPCECYDPATDHWSAITPLPAARSEHAGSAWNNLLFICGGLEQDQTVTNSLMCYKTDQNNWDVKAQMLTPRADHSMVSYKDKLYVCGGWCEDETLGNRQLVTTIDEYDIMKDVWKVVTEIPTPRYHASISIVQEKLYVIGGFDNSATFDRATGVIECFDLEKFEWSVGQRYPGEIWEHASTTLYIPKCREDLDILDAPEKLSKVIT